MKKTQTLFATVVLLGYFAPAQAANRLSGEGNWVIVR
jgi:hypothetical protein